MEYKSHKKNFIMLEEQSRNFAYDKKRPIRGYLKIETGCCRASIRIGAENLQYFDRDTYIYKLIFFGKKNERTIYKIMGSVLINSRGNGETYLKMDPANVDGRGNSLEDFTIDILAAVSMTDRREPLHPVLKGSIQLKEKPVYKEEQASFNGYYNQYILRCCREIERKSELYSKMVPFSEDCTGADWIRVVNLGKFPFISPGAHYMMSKYRHFIFGTGQERYYVGIPGRFLKEEQPEKGKSGFVLWQPIVGAEVYHADSKEASLEARQVAYGYWIAGINRQTGVIEDLTE